MPGREDAVGHNNCIGAADRRLDDPGPILSIEAAVETRRTTRTNIRSAIHGAAPQRSFSALQRDIKTAPKLLEPVFALVRPPMNAPYEHMFWRTTHLRQTPRAVHRALDLARAALLLDPPFEDTDELVDARAYHPHRSPPRRSRRPRRPGAVLARPQHCTIPLVRSAPCSRDLAGRRRRREADRQL
ncbi:MAG TPA: hypothetical protein VFC22_04680 [Solirubrobacteraceae bacterium]|nr:hypothetical protein [Solirubrobacteraceae bacterium]